MLHGEALPCREETAGDGVPVGNAGHSKDAGEPPLTETREASWPRPGAKAVLCKLEKFPRFNGQTVELLCWDAEKERWKCLLANGGDVNVRAENVQPAPGGDSPGGDGRDLPDAAPATTTDPRAVAAQRADALLARGRVYEARLLLSAAGGQPPTTESPLAALGSWSASGPRSEVVEGRLELVDVPGKGKGYRAATPIVAGAVLLFDTALASSSVGPSSNEDMARQVRQLKDQAVMTEALTLQPGSDAEGHQRLLSILANNVFECTRESGRVAFFTAAARFNHSCCPAAYVDATHAECVVRALRDIEVGEEVCISYLPVSNDRSCRQESLRSRGIECGCDRCEAEAKSDPQMAVPCQCGKGSFTVQEASNAYQTCESCMCMFDKEESLHNLSKVSELNTYLNSRAASGADPAELLKKLTALEGLIRPGAKNGVPPLHTASMFLLNHLANLHYHVATESPGPGTSAPVEKFVRYKTRAIDIFASKHSEWTRQRDVDYFQVLSGVLTCDSLPEDCRASWSQALAEACQACFGQSGAPAALAAAGRRRGRPR